MYTYMIIYDHTQYPTYPTKIISHFSTFLEAHSGSGVPTVVGLVAPNGGNGGTASTPAPASAPELPPAPKPGTSTSCTLLLQNMFQPTKERRDLGLGKYSAANRRLRWRPAFGTGGCSAY